MNRSSKFKTFVAIFIFIFLASASFASSAYAQDEKGDPIRKLGRGLSNVTLGLLELPITIEKTGKESGIGPAIYQGVLKGAIRAFCRVVSGAWETATFWIPIPRDYKPIITDPEFIFEKEGI